MSFSTQRAVSDGTLQTLLLSIEYIAQSDITVYIDDVLTPPGVGTWSWVDADSIQFAAPLATGVTVVVRRVTGLATLLHNFTGGASFNASTLDENFEQLLFVAQEAQEGTNVSDLFNDLDMHGFRVTNLAAAVAPGQAVTYEQFQAATIDSAAALRADLLLTNGGVNIGYGASNVHATLQSLEAAVAAIGSGVTLQSFGVIGDGFADDTAAMQAVAAYSGTVIGSKDLIVSTNQLDFTGQLHLDMQGGTIKTRSAFQRHDILNDNVEFHNTVFDGNGLDANVCMFRIVTGNTAWMFRRCVFKNIVGIAGSANQYAVYADADNAVGDLDTCVFQNISNVSDGTPTSAFCGALLLSITSVGAKRVTIKDCVADDIFCTGIAGNINNSDADGIRLFGPQPTVQSNVFIQNFTAWNVQKSGLKVSGNRGVHVNGLTVYNDRSDIGMVAGARFQAADQSIVRGMKLVGRMTVGVNVRSSGLIVDGLTFNPIDTARDTVSGGLVQFQSDDTYKTQHTTIANVVASNVACPFDFDLTGVTSTAAFNFITLKEWDVTAVSVASTGIAPRAQNVTHLTLDGVNLWDPSVAFLNSIAFTRAVNVKLRGCRFEARREMFTWDPNCSGIEVDHCSFFRPDIAATENYGMLVFRNSAPSTIDRVTVRNCTISCPAYSEVGNQHALRFYSTRGVVNGVTIYARDSGANVSPPSGWVSCSGSSMKVSDVYVSSGAALTNGAGGYAVDFSGNVDASMVTDVMNMAGPGVRLTAGSDNNFVDSVAGKTTAVQNTGTGNTVGSTHVLP